MSNCELNIDERGFIKSKINGNSHTIETALNELIHIDFDGWKFHKTGENVLTHMGEYRKVANRSNVQHDVAIEIKFNGRKIVCSPNHRWIVNRGGKEVETMACHLRKGDKLIKLNESV